jgi:hypothetical protein
MDRKNTSTNGKDNNTIYFLPPSFPRLSFVILFFGGFLGEILYLIETTRDLNDVSS